MTVVDVNNVAELYDAGVQALNDSLGPDVAFAFMKMSFPGRGDYTAEKATRPSRTPEQMAAMKARIIEDAKRHGEA